MPRHVLLPVYLFAVLFSGAGAGACAASGQDPKQAVSQTELAVEIKTLDGKLLDAFNHCSDPDALSRHANLLDEHLEFYHDTGGVTWSRQDYIAKTRKNVCGVFQRRIMDDSVRVYPIAGYGAIEEGTHEFC